MIVAAHMQAQTLRRESVSMLQTSASKSTQNIPTQEDQHEEAPMSSLGILRSYNFQMPEFDPTCTGSELLCFGSEVWRGTAPQKKSVHRGIGLMATDFFGVSSCL